MCVCFQGRKEGEGEKERGCFFERGRSLRARDRKMEIRDKEREEGKEVTGTLESVSRAID